MSLYQSETTLGYFRLRLEDWRLIQMEMIGEDW